MIKSLLISVLLLISTATFSQNIKHYKYWNGNYCSNHIYLDDSTGTFYYQEGCEGSVSISKGKFTRKKRKLLLVADTGVSIQLNAFIILNKGKSSPSVSVQAVDFNDVPIKNFRLALLPIPTDTIFMSEMIDTNDSGYIVVDRKRYSHFTYQNVIELAASNNKQIPWMKFEKDYQHFTIVFNYPFFCLSYPLITFNENSPAILKFKKNKLRDKTTKITYSLE